MRHGGGKKRILLVVEGSFDADAVMARLTAAHYTVARVPGHEVSTESALVILAGASRAAVERVRGRTPAPILALGARAGSGDIVAILDAGADDFLPAAFDPGVFLARVRALIRRAAPPDRAPALPRAAGPVLKLGPLVIEPEVHLAQWDGRELGLTRSEVKLLAALAGRPGEVLSRQALIAEVQGEGVKVVSRTVDTQIHGLRRKLAKTPLVVETIRGKGYRLRTGDARPT